MASVLEFTFYDMNPLENFRCLRFGVAMRAVLFVWLTQQGLRAPSQFDRETAKASQPLRVRQGCFSLRTRFRSLRFQAGFRQQLCDGQVLSLAGAAAARGSG